MGDLLKGKQIADKSIGKEKLLLTSPTLPADPITLQYLGQQGYALQSVTVNGQTLTGPINITPANIGLGNVDNTKDVDKPVSNPTKVELDRRIVYGTIVEFVNQFDATTASSYFVTDKGRQGLFVYDPTDTVSNADGILVLTKGTKRYKRVHNRVFQPSWWGIDETGTTSVGPLLNSMFLSAQNNGATVEANGIYLIDEPYPNAFPFIVAVRCNLIGRGVFRTRNGATINYLNTNVTIANITIDGSNGTANVGRGLYNDGWAGATAFNVKVFNTSNQGMWWRNADNAKITNCTTRNNTGENGDGIYVSQASGVQILNNFCTEFQRIGIAVEGNDTGFDYTKDATVIGNIVKNAIPSVKESQNYPNGGIWLENIAGCTVMGNTVENTYFRGIAVTPSIASTDTKYSNIISNNRIKNCHKIDAASGPGYGIAVVYANHTSTKISGNILVDCQRYIGVGDGEEYEITDNTFKIDKDAAADVSALITIDFIRLASPTKKTKVVIDNCVNAIEGLGSGRAIFYPNVNNQRADLEVRNCKGDFSPAIVGTQTVDGDFKFINCTLDWSTITQANAVVFNITGKVTLKDCTVKLNASLFPACSEIEFNNTYCYATAMTRWTQYLNGARIIRVLNGSRFDNVYFYDIRRANSEIYLKESYFDNYPASQGLFVNTVSLVNRLEVDGCRFSETNVTTAPLSFAFGVTNVVVGENHYATNGLLNITGAPVIKQYRNYTIGETQRPATPQLGHVHFNTATLKFERWNGTTWDSSAGFVTNNATTAPTKASLNAAYGAYKAGTIINYPAITVGNGGPKKFIKLKDDNTADWDVQPLNLLA